MILRAPVEWTEDSDYAAEMTNRQFQALRLRLRKEGLAAELASSQSFARLSRSPTYSFESTKARLSNGWNTEYLLRASRRLFSGDQLVYSLQWAFPQAYYAVFAVCLACLGTIGHAETSHSAVMKRFGDLVNRSRYPRSLSFLADGGTTTRFIGVERHPGASSIAFDPGDPKSVDNQIAQFLKGTRERDPRERRKGMSFKTARGRAKKSLSTHEWEEVSKSLGFTSVLSLLYRKRIKANYREIDTFLNRVIEPETLYDSLIHIVTFINFVHEAFIRKALGAREHAKLVQAAKPEGYPFVTDRLKVIERIAT